MMNRKAMTLVMPSLTSVRTVTDIPWYKVTDKSHLHIVDGRSTRRKFEMKLDKLERNKLAVEQRQGSKNFKPKPSELPPLELPTHIERGPSAVLKTIASTLQRDTTAPDYPFHDDPFLIPYNVMDKRMFLMSKMGGKEAARFVLDKHPHLFNNNLIEMQPQIKEFLPKVNITEKNATIELLETLVKGCNVKDAKTTFRILTEKKVEISGALQQNYLEMLCYHNSDEDEMPENYSEVKGWAPEETSKWKKGGEAEHLASKIIQESGLQSEAAEKARLALILGRARFEDYAGVLQAFEEIKVNNGQLTTEGYNAIIKAYAIKNKSGWKDIKQLLETMQAQGIPPDRLTLQNVLLAIGQKNSADNLKTILSVLAEFKSIGIEPSLGAYREILLALADSSHRSS